MAKNRATFIRLSEQTRREAEKRAKADKRTLSAYLRNIIERALDKAA